MKFNRHAARAIRKRSGITQTAVAGEAEINRSNYAHIEAGRREPTDSQIIAIARALVVPISAVASDDEGETAERSVGVAAGAGS